MIATLPTHTSIVENRHKDDEIRRLFLKMGIGLPDGWNLDSPNSTDVLLAAVKTANLVREQREAAEALRPSPDITAGEGVNAGPEQFAEDAGEGYDPTHRVPHRPVTAMSAAQARADCASRAPWRKQ